MRSNLILAPLTVVSLLVTVAAVVLHHRATSDVSNIPGGSLDSRVVTGGDASVDASLLSASRTLLMTGVNPVTPELKDIPVIRRVPWERSELLKVYANAGAGLSCSLLEPGVEVVQPLAPASRGVRGPLGRQTVLTISLQVDPLAKAALPKTTRGAIENYLESNQASVQIVMYHEKDGTAFFGPQARAAFVNRQKPEVSTSAENLVVSAISEFRTLGVYVPGKGNLVPAEARTMILAFRYTRQKEETGGVSSASGAEKDFELLFVHNVAQNMAESPELVVFATSKGRQEISLLETVDPTVASQSSVVAAHVRFDDFTMLGLYPANPVVTGVYHQSQLSLPVSSFTSMMEGVGTGSARNLSEVFDDLYQRSKNPDATVVPDDTANEVSGRPQPVQDAQPVQEKVPGSGEDQAR